MYVPKRYISINRASYAADGKAKATGFNSFKQHVFAPVFNAYTVVLIPYSAIVYPHIRTRNVEPISVEGGQVDRAMAIGLCSPRTNINVPYF